MSSWVSHWWYSAGSVTCDFWSWRAAWRVDEERVCRKRGCPRAARRLRNSLDRLIERRGEIRVWSAAVSLGKGRGEWKRLGLWRWGKAALGNAAGLGCLLVILASL